MQNILNYKSMVSMFYYFSLSLTLTIIKLKLELVLENLFTLVYELQVRPGAEPRGGTQMRKSTVLSLPL
jgi:hypothetical protein